MRKFVHLHLHTEYSILDGAIRINDLFKEAQKLGMDAVAITDHGNLFGVVRFSLASEKYGIKPIIGVEAYVAPESMKKKELKEGQPIAHHITLLAETEEGYHNLVKLVSASYLEGFYYKPRIDKEILRSHSGGIIALSGCLHGEIPHWILQENPEKAEEAIEEYINIFGRDNFFLELMDNGLPEQKVVNKFLIKAAEKFGLKTVATNDAHYLRKEDHQLHDILLCIQTKTKLKDENRMRFRTQEFYFKSQEEMEAIFKEVPEALDTTIEIAERINFKIEHAKNYLLPEFPVPEGYTMDSYFEKLVREGFERRWEELKKSGIPREEYEKRLEKEISVIKKQGFSGYFLIVWDIVNSAKKRGIPVGPGRGSAAGSLVSYCLGITQIDPLKYGLLFERFLNEERVSMPDIDIDFCRRRRGEVIEHIRERYGSENVTQIITFGTMQARAAIRDVGRVMEIDEKIVDRIAKMIPMNTKIKEALANDPNLQKLYTEGGEEIKKLIDNALDIEGRIRQASVHAAGVVISPKPLIEVLPLYRSNKGITTQFEMKDLEALGFLKMDILGLANLTMIDDTIKMLRERKGINIELEKIPLDDKKTWELFQQGKTDGIFQFESRGMKATLVKAKPTRFEHLIALVALYRPGPMQHIDHYIKRMHGKEKVTYPFPELEPILKETYGFMVYQEQVMLISAVLSGFSLSEADILRKAMGKKKKDVMAKVREKFIEGAVKKGKDREKVRRFFDEEISEFAEYAFNKSHSTAYALVAYWTAYLKAHYPTYYFSALLTNAGELGNTADVIKYINDAKSFSIEVLPPDINESEREFIPVDEGKIRFGLSAIKNVGDNAISEILKARRKAGKFQSLFHFTREVNTRVVTKRVMEYLIKAGAMDSFGLKRSQLMELIDYAIDAGKRSGGLLFEDQEEVPEDVLKLPEWDESMLLKHEKEALGFYTSGHPLNPVKEVLKKIPHADISYIYEESEEKLPQQLRVIGVISEKKITKTRKKKRMAKLIIEDLSGIAEAIVFPDTLATYDHILVEDIPLVFDVRILFDDQGKTLLVDRVKRMDEAALENARELRIRLKVWDLDEDRLEQLKDELLKYRGGKSDLVIELLTPEGKIKKYKSQAIPSLTVNTSILRYLRKKLGDENVILKY